MRILNGIAVLCVIGMITAGCASEPRIAFSEADQVEAVPLGMPDNVRFWADAPPSVFHNAARGIVRQKGQPFLYLALSGGGGDGAYGAGILNGWTESGTRPEFTIVSGVSTGALIAPFAFLGPQYDATLKQIYTSNEAQKLISGPDVGAVLFGSGLFGRSRLRQIVERYLDYDMLQAIAREHQKGRRLYVVTTDLDAERGVIWDMGAIATVGGPKALKLFRDVLAASASVPAVFSPQLIDVAANDRRFQEMHVDGTVSTPVFTLPPAFIFGGKSIASRGTGPVIYVIINGPVDPNFEVVPDQTPAIAARSFSTTNRVYTQAVLAQTYNVSLREGFGFKLTYVGKDMPENGGTSFEVEHMQQLYRYGYDKARAGSFWETKPPLEATEQPERTVER